MMQMTARAKFIENLQSTLNTAQRITERYCAGEGQVGKAVAMKEIDERIEANTFIPESSEAEAWSMREWPDGVRIDELKELDTLVVETAHHTYELTVVNPCTAEVLIRGGTFFP